MAKLPQVKGREVVAALKRAGFVVVRVSGSHHNMQKEGNPNIVTVPVHNKPIKRGTLSSIISAAGLTPEQFKKLL